MTLESHAAPAWALRVRDELDDRRFRSAQLTIVVTPLPHAGRIVRAAYQAERRCLVWARDPSVAEAALLVALGADGYASWPRTSLPASAADLLDIGTSYDPVAAAATVHLARAADDASLLPLIVAARLTASGKPWASSCTASGVTDSAGAMTALRESLGS